MQRERQDWLRDDPCVSIRRSRDSWLENPDYENGLLRALIELHHRTWHLNRVSPQLASNSAIGQYDPVYPSGGVDLNWHYDSAWPPGNTTFATLSTHVDEYDGAWAEGQYVYMTWTDNRLLFFSQKPGAVVPRNNRDIRLVRMTWPQ